MKNFLLASIMILGSLSLDVNPQDVYTLDGTIGKQIRIVRERTTHMDGEDQRCPNFRYILAEYEYTSANHDKLFYHVYQCLGDDVETLLAEKVYFSFTENGEKNTLPAGCPTIHIEPPKKQDPCQMGYAIGQVISRTVSNLVVPQLLSDSEGNPINGTPELQQVIALKAEIQATQSAVEFNEAQAKIIANLEEVIRNYANGTIKCITEKVIPQRSKDVELICSEQGAYDSVEDAIKSVLGDEVTCSHINCRGISDDLKGGNMVHRLGLEGDDWNIVAKEASYEPGREDFNGNIQLPVNGQSYMLIFAGVKNKVSPMTWNGSAVSQNLTCDANDVNQKFVFEDVGGFYRIKTPSGQYVIFGENHDIQYVEKIPVLQAGRGLWRIFFNQNGSISFVNRHNSNKTLGIDSISKKFNVRDLNQYEPYERFYLRNTCTNVFYQDVQDTRRSVFNDYETDAKIVN
jgi:hypothetical protein